MTIDNDCAIPLTLKAVELETPLGLMLALGNEDALYALEFIGRVRLEQQLDRLRVRTQAHISAGRAEAITSVRSELKAYFAGKLKYFKTPLYFVGSSFQQTVWQALTEIPYGETRSYLQQAQSIAKPTAYRAVANANGANRLAIIVPCHRIIQHNGTLGGYAAGLERKQWLLEHEQNHT